MEILRSGFVGLLIVSGLFGAIALNAWALLAVSGTWALEAWQKRTIRNGSDGGAHDLYSSQH